MTKSEREKGRMMKVNQKRMVERFLRYVRIDTQSDENSTSYPSTDKQLVLSKLLVKELQELGIKDPKLTNKGYVFATLPSTLPSGYIKNVPIIGLIAHVDTSPDVSGAQVNPVIHHNYQGGEIKLPKDQSQVIQPETDPALNKCLGHDIITTDGTTLLGADNKAGIAEIMTAIEFFLENPDHLHGEIRIAFTVDEEIGQGTKYFDPKEFAAKYAYTIDGETAGELEIETFCADTVIISIKGINIHPGYAKNKMVNSIKIAAELISQLPKDSMSPETTEKREGYLHPNTFTGNVEESIIKFLIRDFTVNGLKEKERYLENLLKQILNGHPKASGSVKIEESYRNMHYVLDKYPHVTDYAREAIQRSGLEPVISLIRGGTDGARLSYQGLPTPNIFTGGHNFHSKREWISIQDMLKAVEVIIHLLLIWTERGEKD
jgi:tripeptide aminopeptidase